MHDTGGASRFAENLLLFCRTLRQAGLPIGPGQAIDALQAAHLAGVQRRDDLYWALSAVLITDPAQFRLFRQAFHVYFRNPRLLARMTSLATSEALAATPDDTGARAIVCLPDTLNVGVEKKEKDSPGELQASRVGSSREAFRKKDFEQMSPAELAAAKNLLRTGIVPLKEVKVRRFRPDSHGPQYDLRRSMQRMLKNDGQLVQLTKKRRLRRPPVVVLLADISGSMSAYSRMFLHFAHVLRTQSPFVHSFVFATRLTNISRRMADRDIDRAVSGVSADVSDWDGGTRIADCLERFNIDWGRRVLARNAVVVLLSDGLERDSEAKLGFQMQRLKRSCRRLIWVNPVLRYADFEPKASGIRQMLPHVDLFLPAHNLDSLGALSRLLEPSRMAS